MSATIWILMIPFMLSAIAMAVGPLLWEMARESGRTATVAAVSRPTPQRLPVRVAAEHRDVARGAA